MIPATCLFLAMSDNDVAPIFTELEVVDAAGQVVHLVHHFNSLIFLVESVQVKDTVVTRRC